MNSRRKFLTTTGLGLGGIIGVQASEMHAGSFVKSSDTTAYTNVLKHNVVGDGKAKNATHINELINKLHSEGGGTIHFPSGNYLTGAIHLKSNITLHLDAGATLLFSTDFDDYLPMVKSRWQGQEVINFSPLIYAYQAENVAITGRGTLNGNGKAWWDYVIGLRNEEKERGTVSSSKWQEEFYKHNSPDKDQSYGFMRPSLLQLIGCKNVLVQGVKFLNSPFWTTHYVSCDDVVVDGVTIFNEKSPNTDGINPESSRNVRISNCNINASDDCITIKSGKGAWGLAHAEPCENITVTNCIMTSGAAGVAIGSEVSGDVRRVAVSNCVFDGTGNGIHIKTNRERGGIIEDVRISNVVMNNVQRLPAIFINMKYWIQTDPQPIGETTPRVRNIHISNITGTNIKRAIGLIGLEEMPMEDVSISQVNFQSEEGFVCENAHNIRLRDIAIDCKSGIPFAFSNSTNIEMNNLKTGSEKSNTPVITMNNVQRAAISGTSIFDSEQLCVSIAGRKSKDILLEDQRLRESKKAVRVSAEVGKGVVR
jgi:polygalacturonase